MTGCSQSEPSEYIGRSYLRHTLDYTSFIFENASWLELWGVERQVQRCKIFC